MLGRKQVVLPATNLTPRFQLRKRNPEAAGQPCSVEINFAGGDEAA
jgi:hypothetical protein